MPLIEALLPHIDSSFKMVGSLAILTVDMPLI